LAVDCHLDVSQQILKESVFTDTNYRVTSQMRVARLRWHNRCTKHGQEADQ
jgi:hypothetical protein